MIKYKTAERKVDLWYLRCIDFDEYNNNEYLRIIFGQQEFPSFNGARDSKEKLFRVASSLGISIGNIEQLLVKQFIIKKEEDYQTIAWLVRMIA